MDKIDFCVTVNGENTKQLLPLFFETFFKVVNTSRLILHIITKNINEEAKWYLNQLKQQSTIPFNIYELNEFFTEEHGPTRQQVLWTAGDTGKTCEWMMENCGNSNWIFISHFDIEFKQDIISWMISHITEDTGLIGEHCPIMLINRTAYNQCFMKFQSLTDFYAIPANEGRNDYFIRYGADTRCTNKSMRIRGFDTGWFLELNIQARGWRLVPFTKDILDTHIFHIRGGSGYHGNIINSEIQKVGLAHLKNKNIGEINVYQ